MGEKSLTLKPADFLKEGEQYLPVNWTAVVLSGHALTKLSEVVVELLLLPSHIFWKVWEEYQPLCFFSSQLVSQVWIK